MMSSWMKIQLGVFLTVIGLLAVFIIYAAHVGRLDGSPYKGIHDFFKDPSWNNFRRFYGDLVTDSWGDILLSFLFLTIPLPEMPSIIFLEMLLLKVAVYKLTVRFIAGTPEFDIEKPVPVSDKIGTWSSLGIAIVIVLVTHLIIGVKGLRKSQVKETKFKTHLLRTLEKMG